MTNTTTATTNSATANPIDLAELELPAPTRRAGAASAAAMTLDAMRMELSSIVMRLTDAPRCDFITRIDLRERQHELRAEIAQRRPRAGTLTRPRRMAHLA